MESSQTTPRPFSASFSDLWIFCALGGDMWRDVRQACDKYGMVIYTPWIVLWLIYLQGPVVRLGPNKVLNENLDGVRRTVAARTFYTKLNWYTVLWFDPQQDSLLSRRNNKIYDAVRAKMKAGVAQVKSPYSGNESLYLEENMNVHFDEFTDLIASTYLSSKMSCSTTGSCTGCAILFHPRCYYSCCIWGCTWILGQGWRYTCMITWRPWDSCCQ